MAAVPDVTRRSPGLLLVVVAVWHFLELTDVGSAFDFAVDGGNDA